jgi:hypothetical protein
VDEPANKALPLAKQTGRQVVHLISWVISIAKLGIVPYSLNSFEETVSVAVDDRTHDCAKKNGTQSDYGNRIDGL